MILRRNTRTAIILSFLLCRLTAEISGQTGISLNLPKSKEYEDRVLRSERSEDKKFNLFNRFIQNTVTHYNYFFNANNKLNEVLDKAKTAFKDDYSALLPFYNYSLDATATDSIQLDSISYKSQSGIALHDLRNDWIDNLYLLWGVSYYLRKQFDSAYLMFQFINYAFAKKEKDGYYVNIGSRMDGNNAFSIATKEKSSLPRKVFSEPPSRNDAFIWQIRNFLAQDLFAEAASLIITLKNDPVFPKRLKNDLEEVQAYWFYKQHIWDSCAAHLSEALDNAANKQERARWEYLLAQLYEMTGQNEEAESYYSRAIRHTTDPILDIYARLFSVRVHKDDSKNYVEKNIATLIKMAKRDKYQDYRDIIYYMAAQMELERGNTDGALALLAKSTKYPSNEPSQRNKAFLQLAELSYERYQFRSAYNFYDSLKMDDPGLKNPETITEHKKIAGDIALNLEIIERQDSLQRIAGLPEEERVDFVKKIVRQLRRQQGLKDLDGSSGGSPFDTQAPPPLFPPTNTKGGWYFENASLRQKGQADFKARWGTRPNQDNWRRSSALRGIIKTNKTDVNDPILKFATNKPSEDAGEITFDALYARLPLTEAQLKQSNDSIQEALFKLGLQYIQQLEDCTVGTETLEKLRLRFPEHPKMDEVLFNLYYCYSKNGETSKAAAIKKLMGEKFPNSNLTTIVTTGKNPESKTAGDEPTRAYEKIYDLFLEGRFEEALAEKRIADSKYSNNYWTPQLLYIESVYYIKQRQDAQAKAVLNTIISRFPQSPLAEKSRTMLDVLGRRQQIEEELRNLVINMPPPDDDTTAAKPNQQPGDANDSLTVQRPGRPMAPPANNPTVDTTASRPPVPLTVNYVLNPESPHYVVLVLSKVDPIFVTEAKNAFNRYNRNTYYNKRMTEDIADIDAETRLLLISPFKNAQEAIDYIQKSRPVTAVQILPWLKADRYYYSIITEKNLELLKNSKDISIYNQFLERSFPGKF